ncbi:periodic tryptophan protein 1 homolog isoform X2 [Uloborus diversus]|uniref:periodic tryptophan protein 1 homolog isoform X2 n=1 Tax=Uloborus diversus TaxID=327109 RepID=UPI002409EEEC|nr:periodic tryptophan protein 1 homolog isoform X2 [Uloborus diversus]
MKGIDEDEEISENSENDEANIKQEIPSTDKTQNAEESDDIEAKYGLDTYDDDESDEKPFFNISDVVTHVDNKDDEYMTDSEWEDEVEEKEDFIIKDTDNLLAVGHIEDESSVLEIYVYNKNEDAFYVHHDIVLPAYPIALEWLNFHASDEKPGNYLAVGDMTPVIKIWDLDVVDILEPEYELGKQKKKKLKGKLGHTDAVLSLSWNKHVRNLLASGSADNSIILWDLTEAKLMNKLKFHPNKVQALQWHPHESPFLLSGCTDGYLKLYDCRDSETVAKSWKIDGEVERVAWNLFDSFKFFCSNDKGFVHCMDMRCEKEDYNFAAHENAVTGLDMSTLNPDILITASMDESLKIWNVKDNYQLVDEYKFKVGSIYAARLAPDLNLTVAVGGNNASNSLKVMDISEKVNSNLGQMQDSLSEASSAKINNPNIKRELDVNVASGTKDFKMKKRKQSD